jgi:hypothetical protein
LLTLGKKGVAGPEVDEFDAPTDVAIAPNGDIFVGDGHTGGGTASGNARIVKFDKNGKFIQTWGRKGMGAGEFDVVHTLAFDSRGRLFVGDRQNNRIQIFDQNGKFIAQWFQFGRPSGMYIDKNDVMYVADSESQGRRGRILDNSDFAQTGYGYNLGARTGHSDWERQEWLREVFHSRSLPLSLRSGFEPGGRRNGGFRGQRVRRRFSRRCQEIR